MQTIFIVKDCIDRQVRLQNQNLGNLQTFQFLLLIHHVRTSNCHGCKILYLSWQRSIELPYSIFVNSKGPWIHTLYVQDVFWVCMQASFEPLSSHFYWYPFPLLRASWATATKLLSFRLEVILLKVHPVLIFLHLSLNEPL